MTGGETSEQPGVVAPGTYILAASIVGVAEKSAILDGSKISEGDAVLAAVSNGLHTNGYSLVRALMASKPEVVDMQVEGRRFLEVILEPHRCYYHAFKGLFGLAGLHGIAHITGGGLRGNLNRILPDGLDAAINLDSIRILPIFKLIRRMGNVPGDDMLWTFNLGVGMTIVARRSAVGRIQEHLADHECESYVIGEIVKGKREVTFDGVLRW